MYRGIKNEHNKNFLRGQILHTYRISLGIISIALLFLFFASCDVTDNNDKKQPCPPFTGQYSDDTAKHNSMWGINLGASLTINKFIMELRYFRSFNEIEGAEIIEKLKNKVHSVQFLVGYSI